MDKQFWDGVIVLLYVTIIHSQSRMIRVLS